jgi:hypothetical protein
MSVQDHIENILNAQGKIALTFGVPLLVSILKLLENLRCWRSSCRKL